MNTQHISNSIAATAASALMLYATAGRASEYTAQDLGSLGGTPGTVAFGINNNGDIVGSSAVPAEGWRAFLWTECAGMIELPSLGGSSTAYDLNESRHIVGGSIPRDAGDFHGVLWAGGDMTDLGTLGGEYSVAYRINNAGRIVGQSSTGDGARRACVWNGGPPADLGTLGGRDSHATGLNGTGAAAGIAILDGGWQAHVVLWTDGTPGSIRDLQFDGSANAINDSGMITGSLNAPPYPGYYWINDTLTLLPSLGDGGTEPWDINSSGDIVGQSCGRAFLWRNGQLRDLNDLAPVPGCILEYARGINDHGQISVYGAASDRRSRRLQPRWRKLIGFRC
jgi:probable HAF family extracellular repeat protein